MQRQDFTELDQNSIPKKMIRCRNCTCKNKETFSSKYHSEIRNVQAANFKCFVDKHMTLRY